MARSTSKPSCSECEIAGDQSHEGKASLLDLFEGRRQLIVVHFMFDPSWENGCPSCTAGADEMAPGLLEHLRARDTTLVYVSRAPLPKLAARADRILKDFETFADKLARHPESLGLGGVVRPSAGLKDPPHYPVVQPYYPPGAVPPH